MANQLAKAPVTIAEPKSDHSKEWARLLTAERRAAWLLNLAGLEFDKLSPGDKGQLCADLAAILEIARAGVFARDHIAKMPFPNPDEVGCFVSQADLLAFHRWLKAGVEALLKGETWTIQTGTEKRVNVMPDGGLWFHKVDPGDVQAVLRTITSETLESAKKITRRCRECGQLFFPRRSQIFCRPNCGHLARTRRWIQKRHPVGAIPDTR